METFRTPENLTMCGTSSKPGGWPRMHGGGCSRLRHRREGMNRRQKNGETLHVTVILPPGQACRTESRCRRRSESQSRRPGLP